MDRLRDILHTRILQHRLRMARSDMFPHSSGHGTLGVGQRLLQQLLRSRTAVPADRQHARMVAPQGGTAMAVVEVVPQRFPRVLPFLFHPDDSADRARCEGHGVASRDHPSALDLRCAVALGISRGGRAVEVAVRLRTLRHNAHIAHRGCRAHRRLSPTHMVRVLPDGQYDTDDMQD